MEVCDVRSKSLRRSSPKPWAILFLIMSTACSAAVTTAVVCVSYRNRMSPLSGATVAANGQVPLSWGWESHKARLCPDQQPNVDLGEALFRAASRELGMSTSTQRWPSAAGVSKRFYRFSSGGFAVAAMDGTRRAAVYVRVWKCANDSIRAWAHASFAQAPVRSGEVYYTEDTRDVVSLVKRAAEAGNGSVVAVTVLRDPVEHFLSGWNEIAERETRRKDATEDIRWDVQRDPEGTFERFVASLVAGVPQFPGQERGRVRSLPHVFAMSGVLVPLSRSASAGRTGIHLLYPQAAASLHDSAMEFPALLSVAAPGTVPFHAISQQAVDANVRTHPSGADALGTYSASKAVFARSGPTAKALCALAALDYACFPDFALPTQCIPVLNHPDLLDL